MDLTMTFRAFRSRNYQLFFWGQLVSRIGMWMQRTAVIWVIYTLTHSVFLLGLTTFAEQFPSFLLSPAGGIAADRYDRYRVMLVTQVVSAVQATALTVLYFAHYREVWLILALSVLLGVANAYDVPARQAMVNDLVNEPADLPNAIAMNSSLNNLARLIGPALSGVALAAFGAGICFAFNAVSFLAVIVSILLMQKPVWTPRPRQGHRFRRDFAEGLRYVRRNREIGGTLLVLSLACGLVATYNTLLPVYAKDIFHGDAKIYGFLTAFVGIGALASTLYIASAPQARSRKHMLYVNLLILGVGLILFSYTRLLPVALLLAAVAGFGTMSILPLCNTIIQLASAPGMRGRAISFFAMAAFGTLPLGSLLVGWVSRYAGVENTIFGQGVLAIGLALIFSKFLNRPVAAPEPASVTGEAATADNPS